MLDDKKETSTRAEVSNPSISNKLLEFQKRVSAISKDSVNPFFKSKYFDVNTVIDTIKPILNEVGLVVSQPLRIHNDKNVLCTMVLDEQGNALLDSEVIIPEITDIQKFGAALTYLRRYALVSLLLLQGEEDDDGNKVSRPPVKQNPPIRPTETPKTTTEPAVIVSPPPVLNKDVFKEWSEKVKKVKTIEELNGYVENLKYISKSMKAGEVSLLRSEFGKKRAELEGEIII